MNWHNYNKSDFTNLNVHTYMYLSLLVPLTELITTYINFDYIHLYLFVKTTVNLKEKANHSHILLLDS